VVTVRRATDADADAVRLLGQEVAALPLLVRYGTTPAGLGEDLARLAAVQDQTQMGDRLLLCFAAVDPEDRPAGFARFQIEGTLGAGGYLRLIAVRPGREGGGLGAALLRAVEDEVSQRSPHLFLLTSDFNHAAQRFYERHGYARVGALPDFARRGITELIYQKRLRQLS
jgi:ribosomal protein S18 acetylase RimI-like enzyme